MSHKAAIILVLAVLILGGGLVTARFGRGLVHTPGQSSIGTPDQVDTLAQSLLMVTPPPGYVGNYGVDTTTFKLAGYGTDAGRGHLVLMQVPDWATLTDDEIVVQALDRLEQEYGVDRAGAAVIDQRTVTTAEGKAQPYTVIEGTGDDGTPYRGLYAIVPIWTGLAFVYFEEPAATWDDATAEALVASIRLPEL